MVQRVDPHYAESAYIVVRSGSYAEATGGALPVSPGGTGGHISPVIPGVGATPAGTVLPRKSGGGGDQDEEYTDKRGRKRLRKKRRGGGGGGGALDDNIDLPAAPIGGAADAVFSIQELLESHSHFGTPLGADSFNTNVSNPDASLPSTLVLWIFYNLGDPGSPDTPIPTTAGLTWVSQYSAAFTDDTGAGARFVLYTASKPAGLPDPLVLNIALTCAGAGGYVLFCAVDEVRGLGSITPTQSAFSHSGDAPGILTATLGNPIASNSIGLAAGFQDITPSGFTDTDGGWTTLDADPVNDTVITKHTQAALQTFTVTWTPGAPAATLWEAAAFEFSA